MLGLYMNLPALEAQEDERLVRALGALLGGEEGRPYLKHLADVAWESEPQTAEITRHAIDAADAHRGLPSSPPPPSPTDAPPDVSHHR